VFRWIRGLRKRPPHRTREEWLNGWADYGTFLLCSPEWKALKAKKKRATNGKCACGKRATELHHKHYIKPLGTEDEDDVELMCWICHARKHQEWLEQATGIRHPAANETE